MNEQGYRTLSRSPVGCGRIHSPLNRVTQKVRYVPTGESMSACTNRTSRDLHLGVACRKMQKSRKVARMNVSRRREPEMQDFERLMVAIYTGAEESGNSFVAEASMW